MKKADLSPLRMGSELLAAAKSALHRDETSPGFILSSVHPNIVQAERQPEFIAPALRTRNEARQSGQYMAAEEMMYG
ncbi:MAG: hypothetical protein ACYC43_00430 [Burkholderiales bacterium]